MKHAFRAATAATMVLLVGLGPAWAQDPIDIDEELSSHRIAARVAVGGGSNQPGQSMVLRQDVAGDPYKIFANIGNGDEEFERVTFTVTAISGPGTNENAIERKADGTLRFTIDGAVVTQTCDPDPAAENACQYSGMPLELYGTLRNSGPLRVYKKNDPLGNVVHKVKLRYDGSLGEPEQQQQQQSN